MPVFSYRGIPFRNGDPAVERDESAIILRATLNPDTA